MRLDLTAIIVAVGLCLIVTGTSIAASTQTLSTGVSLWRGTSKLSDANNRVVDPATGVLTTLTLENCPGIRDRIIQRDALTRTTGTATYRCQVDLRAVVTFTANPTCPPLPAPEGRVVNCPAGYTGAYTQTRSYTAAPYPTCAVLGEWVVPSTLPATCVPAAPPEPPSTEWTRCADEWGFCQFSGTRRVRYGAGSTWIERDVAAVDGGVQCRNSVFGDPAPGATKRCELRAVATDPSPMGTASLSWTPPTRNTDGTSLTNLAGYWIHYGASATQLTQSVEVTNAGVGSYTVPNLSPGTWHFSIRAYTSNGTESLNSNVVSKTVP